MGSAGQSESKCQKLAPIDKKKIFMNSTKKFFMNSTYIVCRKYESNVFGLRRPK